MANSNLQILWNQYYNTFSEFFPTMCFPNDGDGELAEKLRRCIDEGEPAQAIFHLDYSEDIYY